MSQFLYPSYILSQDRKLLLKELTNNQYKSFIKTIAIEDNELLETFIDNLLRSLIYDEDVNVNTLTSVDKLYMLICIRSYCIGPTMTFNIKVDSRDKKSKHKANAEIPLDLNVVLNRLGNYPILHQFSFTENGFTVNGILPRKFYYSDIVDVAVDSLDSIQIGDKSINLYGVSDSERKEILYRLPSSILPKIITFLEDQGKLVQDDPLINFDSKIDLPFGNKIELHMYNGTIGEISKMLFNSALKDIYRSEYTLMKNFKFTHSAIDTSTPAELGVYYEIIQRDMEREKQEQEAQQNAGSTDIAPPTNLRQE